MCFYLEVAAAAQARTLRKYGFVWRVLHFPLVRFFLRAARNKRAGGQTCTGKTFRRRREKQAQQQQRNKKGNTRTRKYPPNNVPPSGDSRNYDYKFQIRTLFGRVFFWSVVDSEGTNLGPRSHVLADQQLRNEGVSADASAPSTQGPRTASAQ